MLNGHTSHLRLTEANRSLQLNAPQELSVNRNNYSACRHENSSDCGREQDAGGRQDPGREGYGEDVGSRRLRAHGIPTAAELTQENLDGKAW